MLAACTTFISRCTQLKTMRPIDPEKACPFVGETLKELRSVVGSEATVLGFVGCPYTLATYMVEVRVHSLFVVIVELS